MNKAERIRVLVEHLRREGLQPRVNQYDVVIFEQQSNAFLVILDDEDPTYYRLVYPDFQRVRPGAELDRAVLASYAVVRRVKAARTWVEGEKVFAGVDLFCSSIEELCRVLPRAVSAVAGGVEEFNVAYRAGAPGENK